MTKKKIEFWDSSSEKPFKYPQVLRLTQEQKEYIEIEQARYRRLNKSRAMLSPAERLKARGVELEDHHKQTGNRDGLAEALAMQGRYKDAAKVALRPDLAAQYAEYASASENEPCKCDKFDAQGMPTEFVEVDNPNKPLIRCTQCRKLVMKSPGEALTKMQEASKSAQKGKEKPFKEVFK